MTQHAYFFLILAIKSLIYGVAVAIAIAVVGTKSSLLKKKTHLYTCSDKCIIFFRLLRALLVTTCVTFVQAL